MAKIKYRYWIQPAEKWISAVRKTSQGKNFGCRGFKGVLITDKCGYCHQYNSRCILCSLGKNYLNGRTVCGGNKVTIHPNKSTSYFWLYVHEMRKLEPNFQKAIQYSTIIRDTILKDCPDRKQAKRDGFDSLF